MYIAFPSIVKGAKDPPILIGATISMEGKCKEPSSMIFNSFKIWEQRVNESGGLMGRPVKFIFYNDSSRRENIRHLYEKLIVEDKVDLVFSPYSTPLTLAATEVSERHKKVMLVCAASGEEIWERGYRYVFGVYALAKRYFIGFLDLMVREGYETVSILYENSSFSVDVAAGAENWANRFGLEVILNSRFNSGKNELPMLLKKASALNADGLILSAYSPDCYHTLDILSAMNYRPKAFGMTIAPVHPDFYKNAGPIAEKVFAPSQWEPDERIPFPGTKQFIKDFVAYTKKMPSYHAGSAFAACQIIEKAIIKTQTLDNDLIRNYIRSLDTVTVIGRFKVDQKGKQIGHNSILIQWQDGKKEIVYPTKMQTAPARF
jgi:branched-chain amino acid transport system substrate-binding protein